VGEQPGRSPSQALGSCLDDGVVLPADAPRGRDLQLDATVERHLLGQEGGFELRLPLEVELDGERVQRVPSPPHHDERVRLHLPSTVPEGAVLRLRGQGEPCPQGRAGDLYLTLRWASTRSSPASGSISPTAPTAAGPTRALPVWALALVGLLSLGLGAACALWVTG